MSIRTFFQAVSLFAGFLAFGSQTAYAADAIDWLISANRAAQQLNYSGNYVYQHGEHREVLRVSHRVDGRNERQKIEVLDGPHREFIRINDDVYCHLADGKTVRVDKSAVQRFFPAVVPGDPAQLTRYYIPRLGNEEKIAGRECQVVILEPRDQFRHSYKIWLDRATGLPLKTQTTDMRGTIVSVTTFSEVEIGKQPDRALFDVRTAGKRLQAAGVATSALDAVWQITPPPGYRSILESMRPLPGKKSPVLHRIYSDGISNFSVFIEPEEEGEVAMEGLSTGGSMNIYARSVSEYKITTVGDVPAAALLETANSVRKK